MLWLHSVQLVELCPRGHQDTSRGSVKLSALIKCSFPVLTVEEASVSVALACVSLVPGALGAPRKTPHSLLGRKNPESRTLSELRLRPGGGEEESDASKAVSEGDGV